ncbi:MAG: hypothetical protein ABSG76_21335, partial [Xanthobacteraceae bacterium]
MRTPQVEVDVNVVAERREARRCDRRHVLATIGEMERVLGAQVLDIDHRGRNRRRTGTPRHIHVMGSDGEQDLSGERRLLADLESMMEPRAREYPAVAPVEAASQQIDRGLADELGNMPGAWTAIDVERRADLLDR